MSLLTTAEAAAALRVHEKTIRRMILRGDLAAVRVGGRYRIDPGDLPSSAPSRPAPPVPKPGKAPGPVTEALRKAEAAS